MATREQRRALLSIRCPWCGAAPGDVCTVPTRKSYDDEGGERRSRTRPITLLDGGCHDARWQRALGEPAAVLVEAVTEAHGRVVGAVGRPAAVTPDLVTVGGLLDVDRPW